MGAPPARRKRVAEVARRPAEALAARCLRSHCRPPHRPRPRSGLQQGRPELSPD